jgi:hypothetical protein
VTRTREVLSTGDDALTLHAFVVRSTVLMVASLACESVPAQPNQGEIGARSEATIRVSVSVAPRFQLTTSPGTMIQLTSNAPRLNYAVLFELAGSGEAIPGAGVDLPLTRQMPSSSFESATSAFEGAGSLASGSWWLLVIPD